MAEALRSTGITKANGMALARSVLGHGAGPLCDNCGDRRECVDETTYHLAPLG